MSFKRTESNSLSETGTVTGRSHHIVVQQHHICTLLTASGYMSGALHSATLLIRPVARYLLFTISWVFRPGLESRLLSDSNGPSRTVLLDASIPRNYTPAVSNWSIYVQPRATRCPSLLRSDHMHAHKPITDHLANTSFIQTLHSQQNGSEKPSSYPHLSVQHRHSNTCCSLC